jgi:hypothetical protein
VHYHWDYATGNSDDIKVTANTQWTLYTGGKAVISRKNLFVISTDANGASSYEAAPTAGWYDTPINGVSGPQVEVLGHPMGDDYIRWTVQPDNTPVLLGVAIPSKNHSSIGLGMAKYKPYITANDARLDPSAINVTNCVGQKMVFKLQFDPAVDCVTNQNNWVLPGKYENAQEWFQPDMGSVESNTANGTYYLTMCHPEQTFYSRYAYSIDSPYCTFYKQSAWPLSQPETGAWWIDGGPKAVTCFPKLTFSNGQSVSLGDVHGNLMMLKPHITRVDTSAGPYGAQLLTNGWPPYLLWLNGGAMDFRVYISKTFPGKLGITQLVNMYSETIVLSTIWTSTGGNYYLDKAQEFYEDQKDVTVTSWPSNEECPNASRIYDTPGQTLGTLEADYTGHWKDYVRFTPDGNNSIPITLGRIDWDWAATALATPHWHITSDGVNGPVQHDDDSFPTWTKSFPNGD